MSYLKGAVKRVAECAAREIMFLVEHYGEGRLGFATWTHVTPVTDSREAQARWRTLVKNHLAERYERIIAVWERHESDGIHWHAIVVCKEDIKTGFDFIEYRRLQREVKEGKRRHWRGSQVGANAALQGEWSWMRKHLRGNWGRFELTPIRANGPAIARYLAKYVTKQEKCRHPEDKGARRVRYVGFSSTEVQPDGTKIRRSLRKTSLHFAFTGAASQLWRAKVASFAVKIGLTSDELFMPASKLGRNWCWKYKEAIHGQDVREVLKLGGKQTEKALAIHEKEIFEAEGRKLVKYFVSIDEQKALNASLVCMTPARMGLQMDMDIWAGGVLTPQACDALGWKCGPWPEPMEADYLAWCCDPKHPLGPESCAWFDYRDSVGIDTWSEFSAGDGIESWTGGRYTGNHAAMSCAVEKEYDSAD